MKLCKDCKHAVPNGTNFEYAQCDLVANPVDGKPSWYCLIHREKGWLDARLLGLCGKEGRFWTPRPEGKEVG